MAIIIKIKRGISTNIPSYIYSDGELVYEADRERLFIGDGATRGGRLLVPDHISTQAVLRGRFKAISIIVNDIDGANLTTFRLRRRIVYFIPFMVNRKIRVFEGAVSVTYTGYGSVSLGIYDNIEVDGPDYTGQILDYPGELLARTPSRNTNLGGTVYHEFNEPFLLERGTLYWMGLYANSYATIRGLRKYSYISWGRDVENGNVFSYLEKRNVTNLPPSGPPSLVARYNQTLPAIFLRVGT